MKKKILIFIIIIEVIALITLCILIYNRLSWKLRGEIIDDHIYKYSIRANEESYAPINIIDDTIYYLLEDQRVFSLYKRNIYSKEEVKVGTIEGENDYCTFDGDFIFCLNTNYDYYNTDLELVYSKSYNNNDSSNVIYYQGKFLLLIDNKIYDNNNIIRQIDFGDTTAYFFGKQVIGDNTFLIFYSPYEKMYIYYDIANDRYEKHFETLESRYNNGVFSVKDSKIIAYDFVNNEFK